MRIISKFHDYYDSVQVHGPDPKRVYVRKTVELPGILPPAPDVHELVEILEHQPVLSLIDEVTFKNAYRADSFGVVAFCGRAYPYYRVRDTTLSEESYFRNWRTLYSVSAVLSVLRKIGEKDYVKTVETSKLDHAKCSGDFETPPLNRRSWATFMEKVNLEIGPELFRRFDAPVVVASCDMNRWNNPEVIVNPRLAEFDFASVVHPFEAFQAIEQFLGNELARQSDPIVEVPDEIKAESHGSNKASFRRDKHPRKNRKKGR